MTFAGKLRGARYYIPERHDELARVIIGELPYYDYDDTLAFYAHIIPALDLEGSALLACNDRFYLLTTLLKRADALHPWLFERCREVEAKPYGCLDLWAREHYKSTIITFAGIIQEVLTDPEITVGIFSHTADIAAEFLSQIMREFESNEELIRTFHDVLWQYPRRHAQRWSVDGGIVLKRLSNPKEATIEAWGLVKGQPTGKHFTHMYYDDVVTKESVTTPEMVKATTEAYELSDNLGAGNDVKKAVIGTRYSFADTYGVLIERNVFDVRLYPATHDGKLTGKPVFISEKRWNDKKNTQRSTVAAQMLQNPLAGKENTFSVTWFRPFYVRPRFVNVYIMVDPAKKITRTSDRTAIAVVAVDSRGNRYFVDGFRHRMSLSERYRAVKMLHQKWTKAIGVQNVKIGYERYGQQSDDEYFALAMQEDKYFFSMEEVAWSRDGANSKKDRVERLEPDFKQSKFYLPAQVFEPGSGPCLWKIDVEKSHVKVIPMTGDSEPREIREARKSGKEELIAKPIMRLDEDKKPYDVTRALMEEMIFFPFAPKDDLVDATSRLYDLDPVAPAFEETPGGSPQQRSYEDA